MAITITRDFSPADRYLYDFKVLTIAKGWAQIDSPQDASYFGTWISPSKRMMFNYCEGDCTITQCDTDAELVAEVERMNAWNAERGERLYSTGTSIAIDPGMSDDIKAQLVTAGLSRFIH